MKKLKNKEVLALFYSLPALGNLKGVKFNYGIDKNRKRLKKQAEDIEERIKMTPDFEAYDKARVKINEKYSSKAEDGSAKMVTNDRTGQSRYIIDEKRRVDFDKEQADLKEKNKLVIEEREALMKEYREFLEEYSNTYVPYEINFDDIPNEVVGEQFELISNFLPEDEEVESPEEESVITPKEKAKKDK